MISISILINAQTCTKTGCRPWNRGQFWDGIFNPGHVKVLDKNSIKDNFDSWNI